MGPENISSHKYRTLAPIFTNCLIFFKNHEMNPIKSQNLNKCLKLGAWGLEPTFWPRSIGPEDVSSHKFRTLAPILTSRASFSQESWDESNKTMKFEKMSWPCNLGPRNYIWATCDQKTYEAVKLNVQHNKYTM